MALPKRIIKETERLVAEPVPGINAVPHEDNLRYFDVTIHGPTQSPYEGGIFRLELFLPEDYPMTPPKIRFLTKDLPSEYRQTWQNLLGCAQRKLVPCTSDPYYTFEYSGSPRSA